MYSIVEKCGKFSWYSSLNQLEQKLLVKVCEKLNSLANLNSFILQCSGSGSVIICTDPEPEPSINMQKSKKNPDFYYFLVLFDF